MAKSGGGGARGFANRRGYSIRGATDSQVARGYRYRVVGKGSRQGSFLAMRVLLPEHYVMDKFL